MQEKKNKRLLISLLVLMTLTAALYWLGLYEKATPVDKNIFHLKDYKAVDKITLESSRGKEHLTFNGTRWKINERYDADRNMINLLFATLQQAEPRRPVAASVHDSLRTALKKNGVRVSLYEGEKLVQNFYAGGNALKTQAYFMDTEGSDIYVMMIPGYRAYVSWVLELSENQWRDKIVFGFNWRNFQSLKAEFADKPSENFTIEQQGNFFGIPGISADTTKLNAFMDNIFSLAGDEYVDSEKLKDSLLRVKPFMTLTVRDIAQNDHLLKLFRENSKQVPGLVQEGQVVLFNPLKIRSIVRPKSFFKK
jgi:hypothetical protein